MYRFRTKDGRWTRVTPSKVEHIIPSGNCTGYVKLVLNGGHAVTVEGETEAIYEILGHYINTIATADADGQSEPSLARAVGEAREATAEYRSALNNLRDRINEAEAMPAK